MVFKVLLEASGLDAGSILRGLGRILGGGWESWGKDLEALGTLWAVLRGLFFMLVFGVVFKSALGGLWARLWANFRGAGTNFGRVWGRFWEGLGGIFERSGRFWSIIDYSQ